MSFAVGSPAPRVHLPLPVHFSHAEKSFSLKKRRFQFPSSSWSNSPCSSPAQLSLSLPPLAPAKECSSVSRVFHPSLPTPWTPLSKSLSEHPSETSGYDPSKQKSYFTQCFTNLGILGRGSFGEVYKVRNNKDGRLYAIKLSTQRFRGNAQRNRSIREAWNHERICPHPHILNFVAAWEEAGRLYIQTELCSTSLLDYAETKHPGPDEPAAWSYLCDLLSALQHLHSQGFVHFDLKPANVLITDSGRLKLGDFGLLVELKQITQGAVKEDVQEGDPRYMAPELLYGEYGPAADVFSLGVSILELACNIELPNGGEGWQQLRQGKLPSAVTKGLTPEFQTILKMMLAPVPSERATASELLALPAIRKHRWKRQIYLLAVEAMLTLVSLCQFVVCFGCRLLSCFHLPFLPASNKAAPGTPPSVRWEGDVTPPVFTNLENPENTLGSLQHTNPDLSPSFFHQINSKLSTETTSTPLPRSPISNRTSPANTSTCSIVGNWSPRNLALTPSSIHTNTSFQTVTPGGSPIQSQYYKSPSSIRSSVRCHHKWFQTEDALIRPNLEPKNLLLLFEETTIQK